VQEAKDVPGALQNVKVVVRISFGEVLRLQGDLRETGDGLRPQEGYPGIPDANLSTRDAKVPWRSSFL